MAGEGIQAPQDYVAQPRQCCVLKVQGLVYFKGRETDVEDKGPVWCDQTSKRGRKDGLNEGMYGCLRHWPAARMHLLVLVKARAGATGAIEGLEQRARSRGTR